MKFIYLSDSHLGADGTGFHQQPMYATHLTEIVKGLKTWLEENPDVEFILHGGDLCEWGTEELIRQAEEMFQFSVPMYLCLGNHDLTEVESLSYWLKHAGRMFPEGKPEFTIRKNGGVLHVAPNHWEERKYFWDGTERQLPWIADEQWSEFESAKEGEVEVFVTHSPVLGVPPSQTGMDEMYHEPIPAFREQIANWGKIRQQLKYVLGGHNHLNMREELDGITYITAPAFSEAPFEFKIFQIDDGKLQMETVSLRDYVDFPWQYDSTKSYVQGEGKVREF